ncbi:ribosome maturation factor RimM [Lactobacillus terrae]|uniref:ribosome maturation factor RimM n=1 Tax=Lactobacillus terrae TaxID=2269374 RepID=UPI000C1B62D2|nr:ribosome maturation factor RimM [Lactobacillus terrae]
MPEKLYRVGTIVNTHGIRGEVRVISVTDFPKERFQSGATLYLKYQNKYIKMTVESSRPHKKFYLLKFKDLDNINDVEKYVKSELFTDDEVMPELEEGEFYYRQIIGLEVQDPRFGNVGKITEIMELGPNDVWVVKSPKYDEVLIPYIKSVVKNVDLEKGIVNVEIPDGLIE